MAEPKELQKDFYEQVAPLFGKEGVVAWGDADDLLAKNPKLATLITPSGASAADVALANKTPWLARDLAVIAQLEAHPEQKPAYEKKLAEALEADRKQRPAGYVADRKVRAQVQDEWLLSLDEKTLTPAAKRMQSNIKLEAWKRAQNTETELGSSYMHIAAKQDRPDILILMKEQMEGQMRGLAGRQETVDQELLGRQIRNRVDEKIFAAPCLDQQTPLIVAARHGKLKSVDFLMTQWASPYAQTVNGGHAAHHAAVGNHKQVLELLHEHKFQIHHKDRLDDTPLDVAMQAGNKEIVSYLVENAKNKKDFNLQPYLDRALGKAPTPEMAKHIIALGANPKHTGGEKYSPPLVAMGGTAEHSLVDYGIEKIKVDRSGVLDLLLQQGADPNLASRYLTPLQNAIEEKFDNKDIMKLLERTKDLRAKDAKGNTALHYAVASGNTEILKVLIKKDPELLKIDNLEGRTPLLEAVALENLEMVRELAKISDKDAIDKYGNTTVKKITHALAYSHDDTPRKDLEKRLEILRLVRSDKNANIPFISEDEPPKKPSEMLQQQVDELKQRMINGNPLKPSEIDKLEFMNRAIREIQSPGTPVGLNAPPLEESIKKAATAVPKPGDVSVATPSEKASALPLKPSNPTLAL